MGQTTVCETGPGLLPNLLPNYGTVCDGIPNYLGLGALGHWPGFGPINSLPTTVCESSPNYLGLGALGLGLGGVGLPSMLGSTMVCEKHPNIGMGIGLPGLLGLTGSMYDSYPGFGLGSQGLLGLGSLNSGLGTTTVCESTPNNALGLNHPLGINHHHLPILAHLGVNPLAIQGMLGLGGVGNLSGSTTVCDSVPNVHGLGGLGLGMGLGRPFL